MLFNLPKMGSALLSLLPYIPFVLAMVALSFVLGSLFGFLLAFCKLGKNRFLKDLAYVITAIVRGTPFIVMLFVVFYGLPLLLELAGIDMSGLAKMVYMLITLTLFSGTQLSEVFRSAYEAVQKGQREAALCIGHTEAQAFFRILLPQAFYISIPNIGNALIGIMMETSLGYTIGMIDLLGKAKLVDSLSYGTYTMEIYVAVALIYWALSILIDKGMGLMEKIFGRQNRQAPLKRGKEGI